MNEEQRKKMDAMLAQQEKEMRALAKEHGLDGSDDDDDPDVRELKKQMKKNGKIFSS